MRSVILLLLVKLALFAAPASRAADVRVLSLLENALQVAPGLEVRVSRVEIPPNTSLPKHWHPGEEFAYILEGSVTLWQAGERDTPGVAGDLLSIPLKRVHTAITGGEGVILLIFRVHPAGEPERVNVE